VNVTKRGDTHRPSREAVPHGLAATLARYPGKFLAVDRSTNEERAVADSPEELVAEVRRQGLHGVAIVRAPMPDEPQLVGLG
jgi:hypothetical protein